MSSMLHRPVAWIASPWVWGTLLAAYWIALFSLTHAPGHRMPSDVTTFDKLLHAGAYAALATLAASFVSSIHQLTIRGVIALGAGLALYGALDELTQPLVGRTCDVYDWLADVSGVAIGLAAFAAMALLVRRIPIARGQ